MAIMLHPTRLTGLCSTTLLAGCVALHAPLERDDSYPNGWPEPVALSDQCHGLAGTYSSVGISIRPDGTESPISLFATLNLKSAASSVSLEVVTRRVDNKGDTFSTLIVKPGDDPSARHEIASCYCVRRTLVCTQLGETYWRVNNLGFGGRQSNIYINTAADDSLILRLQNYRVDVVLGVPLFRNAEPWARFVPVLP